MTDAPADKRNQATTDAESDADAERRLGRTVALALPATAVVGAVIVGVVFSAGPAVLVLLGGALLGTIALFWASVRTLGGDAPLPEDLEALSVSASARGTDQSDLASRKRTVLRALKDLEHEHAIGKIDDADFAELSRNYRAEAKEVMRELDLEVEPFREKAEQLVAQHLAAKGLDAAARSNGEPVAESAAKTDSAGPADKSAKAPSALVCPKCATENDADAAFCKKCATPLTTPAEPEASVAKEPHA